MNSFFVRLFFCVDFLLTLGYDTQMNQVTLADLGISKDTITGLEKDFDKKRKQCTGRKASTLPKEIKKVLKKHKVFTKDKAGPVIDHLFSTKWPMNIGLQLLCKEKILKSLTPKKSAASKSKPRKRIPLKERKQDINSAKRVNKKYKTIPPTKHWKKTFPGMKKLISDTKTELANYERELSATVQKKVMLGKTKKAYQKAGMWPSMDTRNKLQNVEEEVKQLQARIVHCKNKLADAWSKSRIFEWRGNLAASKLHEEHGVEGFKMWKVGGRLVEWDPLDSDVTTEQERKREDSSFQSRMFLEKWERTKKQWEKERKTKKE